MKRIEYRDEDYQIEESDLVQIKKKYWDIFTYQDDDGIEYYYRPLTKKEYYDAIVICTKEDGKFNQIDFEDLVVATAVIAPISFDQENTKAGVISTLAAEVLKKSGFEQSADDLSNQIRAHKMEMLEPLNQMLCYIKEAFPDLDFEELDDMPLDKIIWYFSRADFILRVIKNQPIQILTPKEYMELNDLGLDFDEMVQQYGDEEAEEEVYEEPIISQPKQTPSKPKMTADGKHKVTQAETTFSDGGSAADFPELREIEAFMRGELWKD